MKIMKHSQGSFMSKHSQSRLGGGSPLHQAESEKAQLPPAPKYMGASGGIGLVAGTGAKIAKGAFQVVKSIFKKKTPVGSGPSRGGNFNEIANQKLREGLNKTKVPKSKPVEFMGPNPANKIGAGGNSYPR